MFSFLKQRQEKASERFAPGTRIPYRETLVGELTSEHHALVLLFHDIVEAHGDSDDRKVYQLLCQFKNKLRSHLLKENTYLYIYLKYASRHDNHNSQLVANMQQEMGEIGKSAFHFVKKWTRDGSMIYGDDFLAELRSVGEALAKRMKSEERTLYPIYSESEPAT